MQTKIKEIKNAIANSEFQPSSSLESLSKDELINIIKEQESDMAIALTASEEPTKERFMYQLLVLSLRLNLTEAQLNKAIAHYTKCDSLEACSLEQVKDLIARMYLKLENKVPA